MNLGVQQRCRDLQKNTVKTLPRKFMHLIPLVEVITVAQNLKSINSNKVRKIFDEIMNVFPSEIALWQSNSIHVMLDKRIDEKTINHILAVQCGSFKFDPPGHDGIYGKLQVGVY